MSHIYSVSALTGAIKQTIEGGFPFVWVRGQVANLSRPSSGHVYFSLKDEHSSLAAVWFKGSQHSGERFDPLTGEVYEDGPKPSLAGSLENGMELVCAGRITLYAPRGVYQLVVEIAQDAGLGKLQAEFARLKARLETQGYFAVERKRPLPPSPTRVAVITAPQGAAIHDFLRIAEGRGLKAAIRIFPVPVQGENAPGAIEAAFARIKAEGWAETVVLIRGGGSLEDLWAFNDERVAGAVYDSPVPVLAGIGHEVDFTLADLTADVRAATPTHAAQLLWPERAELARRLAQVFSAFRQAGQRASLRHERNLAMAMRELEWLSPKRKLQLLEERLASAARRLAAQSEFRLEREEARLARLESALRSAPGALPAKEEALRGLLARLSLAGPNVFRQKEEAFARVNRALASAPGPRLANAEHTLETALLKLEACNPHAPLARGYALATKADGTFVRLTSDVAENERLLLTVSNGKIPVRVEGASQ